MNNNNNDIKKVFHDSREVAICRCVGIMIDAKRKDLGAQILQVLKIDREKFEKIKAREKVMNNT